MIESKAKGSKSHNEAAQRNSNKVQEVLSSRAVPRSEYYPPGALCQTVDIGLQEMVVRNGSDKGLNEENVTFYVLRCPMCASVSSEAIVDKDELEKYWNAHWQSHEPGEKLKKDQIVEKFGIPISDATSQWFKRHQTSQIINKRARGKRLLQLHFYLTSFLTSSRTLGTRRNTTAMTAPASETSKPQFGTDGGRPRQSKPSLPLISLKMHQSARRNTSSAKWMSTLEAPHFGGPTMKWSGTVHQAQFVNHPYGERLPVGFRTDFNKGESK